MSAWLDNLVAWIGTHPVAAGALIFAIAFCDAAIVLGALVPAMPLIFAVGVLVGLGEVSGPYAIICAALGAHRSGGSRESQGARRRSEPSQDARHPPTGRSQRAGGNAAGSAT
jgi:hypothetical protein